MVRNQLANFHDPSVSSNGHAPLTVMPIYGKNNDNNKKHTKKTHSSSKPRTAQKMILSFVAMTGLEKCCITSAYNLQWLFHSGERADAHGPLDCLF